jgi:hypothetical protein
VVAAVEHALAKERPERTPSIDAFVLELTGKALADVSDETSGVFQPGMSVTSSMVSGATRAPSGPRILATPAPSGAPVAPAGRHPADAPTISGKKFIISVIVVVLALAGLLTKIRMDNWADRAAYRASMIDAGWTLMTDGTLTFDAGAATPALDAGTATANAVDAGALAAEPLDAGSAVAGDAGAPKPVRVEAPLPPAEQAELERLRAMIKARQFDALWDSRIAVRVRFDSPAGRRHVVEVLLEVACARNDNTMIRQHINEYRLMPGANMRAMRATCVKHYAAAVDFDW